MIICSSVAVSFWRFSSVLVQEVIPWSRSESLWCVTLKATAARRSLLNWPDI
jgi:hypothetical protein